MLMPRRVKFRKHHRGRMKGISSGGCSLTFGEYGLKSLEPCWFKAKQIEAARVAISHGIKKGGKLWVKIFPDKCVTKKPAETRMGKGKGAPDHWVAIVKPGRILFELEGMDETFARELMGLAASKLPFKTKFIKRDRSMSSGRRG